MVVLVMVTIACAEACRTQHPASDPNAPSEAASAGGQIATSLDASSAPAASASDSSQDPAASAAHPKGGGCPCRQKGAKKPTSPQPGGSAHASSKPLGCPPAGPLRRGTPSTGCLSRLDCDLVYVYTCDQIRNCTAACPGVGKPLAIYSWSPTPAQPDCGPPVPCTPACPAEPPRPLPRAACVDRKCVVVR
jgi:hypothetical protein